MMCRGGYAYRVEYKQWNANNQIVKLARQLGGDT